MKLYRTSDQKLAYNLHNFEQNLTRRNEIKEQSPTKLTEFKNAEFRYLGSEKFEKKLFKITYLI